MCFGKIFSAETWFRLKRGFIGGSAFPQPHLKEEAAEPPEGFRLLR